jgi:ABC-type cobalt transport system substrate-binding protein
MTLADQGEKSALLTNIFIIGGVAVALTGALLFFTGADEDSENTLDHTDSALNPWFNGQGGFGLDWGFRY